MLKKILLLLLTLCFCSQLLAAGKPFDQVTFDQAQKDGKPILVMIHADWCPTCRAQATIIERLAKNEEFRNFVMLRVDYDHQEDLVKAFVARKQSRLIVFKGDKEIARSLGDTREESIATMMRKAL